MSRAAERLRVAADARSRAEVEEAVAIVELSRACEWPEDASFDVIGTRPVRIGADGTALVDEFLPLEVAAIKGISVASATYADVAVDSYEIPERIRRQVLLRDQVEVFPYSSRSARGADLDHTRPYRPGRRDQTRASNLGPLSRKAHRGKTHGGWRLSQPAPGVFHWRSPAGLAYRVTPSGTSRLDSPFDEAVYRLAPSSSRNVDTS